MPTLYQLNQKPTRADILRPVIYCSKTLLFPAQNFSFLSTVTEA